MAPDTAQYQAGRGTLNVTPGGGSIGRAPGADGVAGRTRDDLPQKPEVEGSNPSRQESTPVYFSAACGHQHSTAREAAACPQRGGWCWDTFGPWPVVRVTQAPGRITRTEQVPDGI